MEYNTSNNVNQDIYEIIEYIEEDMFFFDKKYKQGTFAYELVNIIRIPFTITLMILLILAVIVLGVIGAGFFIVALFVMFGYVAVRFILIDLPYNIYRKINSKR